MKSQRNTTYNSGSGVNLFGGSTKEIPHSIEAEMSLLGAVMLGGIKTLTKVESVVPNGSHFYRQAHGRIYEAMKSCAVNETPIDIVTVMEALKAKDILEDCGGIAFLMQIGEFVPTVQNAMSYADQVRHDSDKRSIIEVAHQMVTDAMSGDYSAIQIADNFALKTKGIMGGKSADAIHIDDSVKPVIDEINDRKPGYRLGGISSGFTSLDTVTGGWRKGELIILGARPSMGKSAFALNLVMNAAKAGKTALFISIEMSEKMTTHRLLSMSTGIDLTRLQNSVLSPSEMMQLRKARADLFDLPLYLAAYNPMTTHDIRTKCVKLASKSPIDFIVVDYLQMIATPGVNRVTEVGQLSRFLKGLAREMDCPVMALSSLNRAADKREDKRPVMSDLRESGDIESDADLAMFLYRPSYYQPTQLRDEEEDETEVVIGKNRNGPVGIVRLSFVPSQGTFVELEPTLL